MDAIFYPCMSYNIEEKLGDNHFNCPVVAYYPEVIRANCLRCAKHALIFTIMMPAYTARAISSAG